MVHNRFNFSSYIDICVSCSTISCMHAWFPDEIKIMMSKNLILTNQKFTVGAIFTFLVSFYTTAFVCCVVEFSICLVASASV
jgi:hypothetical protein